jgi:hypothetical protein
MRRLRNFHARTARDHPPADPGRPSSEPSRDFARASPGKPQCWSGSIGHRKAIVRQALPVQAVDATLL